MRFGIAGGFHFEREPLVRLHRVERDMDQLSAALQGAAVAGVVAQQALEHGEQVGPQFSRVLAGGVQRVPGHQLLEKFLGQVLRVVRAAPAVAEERVNRIPVSLAQLFHRARRFLGVVALHRLHERPAGDRKCGAVGFVGRSHAGRAEGRRLTIQSAG